MTQDTEIVPEHCVVFFSGGAMSWAAAKRAVAKFGARNTTLLFTDTLIEDEDLYRFLPEAAANVGAKLVWVTEGRTPWQVFMDEGTIGRSGKDPCSKILKREAARKWLEHNVSSDDTLLVFGIDWSEQHRTSGATRRWKERGFATWYPLTEPPLLTPQEVRDWMESEGLRPPRLYDMGFAHNNCGGFCIKAGQAHFKLLLETMPERYREHEQSERVLRRYIGRDLAVMRRMRGGEVRPLTLEQFRAEVEAGAAIDELEVGGCGCFIDEDEEPG